MTTRVFLIGWVLFIAESIGFADDSKPVKKEWDNPRGYKIMKPDNLDSEKNYPLIISLHGFTSNGAGQEGFFPLRELAEKHGFFYCYPSGLDRSWNATEACCDWRNRNDDSTYLRELILWAQKTLNIDKKRVYLTGLSNGGFMSYRMATDHADLITAIAPFAGVGYKKWPKNPSESVSVLHIHGTNDRTIKWDGGGILARKYPSVEENFEMWRKFNQCGKKQPVTGQKIDLARRVEGKETIITSFANKDGSVLTELWRTENGGHVTPPTKEARERIVKWLLDRSK